MSRLISDIPNAIGICICQEPIPKQIGAIEVLPWDTALKKYFTIG